MEEVETYRQQANTDKQEEKQKYQELYVNTARDLFEDTANVMKKFLAKLYSDSEKELTIPSPCKYAVIGLGSMALKQMTPYSDLEFAILTENDYYQQSNDPKIREYFRNLSHLVNFRMCNLGETIIPTSKYGLDMSHLVHRGVNFDLGGKTPLGRIEQDKPYELIKTINGMLYYVRNEGDKASHIDKNLPYILEKVCYVHGNEQLVKSYQEKVTEFLHSRIKDVSQGKNCEIRAIKLLKEGAVEINYLQQTTHKKGDLDKLQPDLCGDEGRLFDVKQEIYRLPDRLLYNLSMYYGIEADSAWDAADKLGKQGVISLEAVTNLKNAVTFATTLRLNTYLYHKAQTEDMSIFTKSVETKSELKAQAAQIFHLSKEDLEEQGGLFQYFYTALPLHKMLQDFCVRYKTLDNTSKQTFFQDNGFYIDDYSTKGLIHYRLAQYKEAQTNLEIALNKLKNLDNWQIKNALGNIYNRFGNGDKAIEQFKDNLYNVQLIYKDEPHQNIATSLHNLGTVYYDKRQYDQAIEKYQESLEMMKRIYKDEPHPKIANFLNNLGLAYAATGQYDQVIEKVRESLKIMKLIYKEEPHPYIAGSLNNLGIAYRALRQYDQAIEKYQESLKMKKLIYKDEPHPDIAVLLNNLGIAYKAKGQYDQAIEKHQESLEMMKLFYKDEPQPNIAQFLNNLGLAYAAEGQYDEAIEKYQKSLKMMKLIYKKKPHPNIADFLNNLGLAYAAKRQYDQAIKKYQKSLEMMKLIYKNKPHPNIANFLNNLGLAYAAKGQYDQAIEKFRESLEMMKRIYKDEPHPNIANFLNNLGLAYFDKGQYDQAIENYRESLKMMKRVYKDKPHLNIALSLDNLGLAYTVNGQYDKGIEKVQESLEMMKLILKNEYHPNIADSLNNLGFAYMDKRQYDPAIEKTLESYERMKLIYKNELYPDINETHNNIAISLNNLGLVYGAEGKYDNLIEKAQEGLKLTKLILKNELHPDINEPHPDNSVIAVLSNNLGTAHGFKGQNYQAIEKFQESRKLIFPPDDEDIIHSTVQSNEDIVDKLFPPTAEHMRRK